jgi:hypothetical protein
MSQPRKSPEIKVAYYGFRCPITGEFVRKGSNYYYLDGLKFSINCDLSEVSTEQ